jgi:hypothetical protein
MANCQQPAKRSVNKPTQASDINLKTATLQLINSVTKQTSSSINPILLSFSSAVV